MLNIIKPIPVIISLVTMLGIVMHDMHIDKAATVAVSLPVLMATTGALEKVISPNYHTHVERASIPRFNSTLPNAQPPRDDDRRYIQNKKLMFMGGGDRASLWPSV